MVLAVREGEWVPKNLSTEAERSWEVECGQILSEAAEEERGNRRGAEEPDMPG